MDLLEVALVHPITHQEMVVVGQVMHKRDSRDPRSDKIQKGVGIQFTEMTEEKQKALDAFLASLTSP